MNKAVGFLMVCSVWVLTCGAEPVFFDFNDYQAGPLEGQHGWSVFNKVADSSAFSVVDGVGKTEAVGDKALVLQSAKKHLRLVAPESLSWMPGDEWTMEFDFKVGIPPKELLSNKPVMTVCVGNTYLTERARWLVRLEAAPDGSWRVIGGLPDLQGVDGIPAETIVEKEPAGVAISEWLHFVLKTKKLEALDSFESLVEIHNAEGQVLASRKFSDTLKDRTTASMWNLSRMYCGFSVPKNQLGLACIDNLMMVSSAELTEERIPSSELAATETQW